MGQRSCFDVENECHLRDESGLCVECGPDEVGEFLGRIPGDPDDPPRPPERRTAAHDHGDAGTRADRDRPRR